MLTIYLLMLIKKIMSAFTTFITIYCTQLQVLSPFNTNAFFLLNATSATDTDTLVEP